MSKLWPNFHRRQGVVGWLGAGSQLWVRDRGIIRIGSHSFMRDMLGNVFVLLGNDKRSQNVGSNFVGGERSPTIAKCLLDFTQFIGRAAVAFDRFHQLFDLFQSHP